MYYYTMDSLNHCGRGPHFHAINDQSARLSSGHLPCWLQASYSGPFAQTQAQALGTVLTIRGEPVSHGWPRGNLQRRLFLVGHHATPATHQLYLRGPPQGVFEVCFERLEDFEDFEGFASRVSTLGATAPVARSIYPLNACLPGDRCNDGRLQIWMVIL